MSDDNIVDGKLPFADQRFSREVMIDVEAPVSLAQILEVEIQKNLVTVPSHEFLEIRCASEQCATAVFMVRRGARAELRILTPAQAIRKPN